MSRTRTTSDGFVAKLAGMSVNGTTVSPSASAGTAHSGIPNAARPAVTSPLLRTSRRVVINTSEFRHHELEEFQRVCAPLRDLRGFAGAEIDPVALRDLMILAVEGDGPLAFHQIHELIVLRVARRVVLLAGVQPAQRADDVLRARECVIENFDELAR